MRKAILWLLIALMALQGLALAEPTVDAAAPNAAVEAVNGLDAARTASEIYLILPSGEGDMLVRLPLDGSQPVCMDRADSIESLMNYGAGAAYLKTTDGASAIISCVGNQQSTLYSFGVSTAEHMTMFGGKLLVLMNGLLHSIEPDTGVCLKLSGAQMLDYVLGDGYAYYLADGDKMEYTAQLSDDETATTQAGCIYRLNLNNGETDLLLKSGGEDLKILDNLVYFHNLADAYAVRTGESAELRGRVYSLDTQLKTLNSACAEPDSGFWPTRAGVVAWYNSALNLGETSLYAPENGSSVTFDGEALYVWEPTKLTLTEVRTDGSQTVLYSGDLTQAVTAALLPETTPTIDPSATPGTDEATQANSDWFTDFMNNVDAANGSTGSTAPKATPIGVTPTPVPTATAVPVSTPGTDSSNAPGSSSTTSKTTYSTYSTSVKSLRITSAVNLRSKPLTSSTIYTSIPAGKIVSCTGTAAKTSGGSVWYQVKYNGTTGWIYSAYAEKYSSSSDDSDSQSDSTVVKTYDIDGKYVKVVGGSVNIRSKAGTSYKVVGSMPSGAYGSCLGTAAKDTRGVVWYKVKYNGVTGWVSSRYSKITNSKDSSSGGSSDTVKVVGGDVTIRSKADKTSAKLGYIAEGKVATYLGKTSTDSRGVQWYYISYNGTKGWISSMYSRLQ
ncbi:MAG: SH3 domain-containing protein [Clostridia bacterium]|nr:SH3 domain-containing protein [Clostridia bacterium]